MLDASTGRSSTTKARAPTTIPPSAGTKPDNLMNRMPVHWIEGWTPTRLYVVTKGGMADIPRRTLIVPTNIHWASPTYPWRSRNRNLRWKYTPLPGGETHMGRDTWSLRPYTEWTSARYHTPPTEAPAVQILKITFEPAHHYRSEGRTAGSS